VILEYSDRTIEHAARIISGGGVIAFRTDTFYGLGGDAFNPQAVRRIRDLKGREDDKPILIVISDLNQIDRFIVSTAAEFEFLAKSFWPGALTIVGKAHSDLPEVLTAGTGSVGVRLPNDDGVRALIQSCGGALTATSANPSHAAPAANAQAVQNYFGADIDLIVDDGEARTTLPSTVVDATADHLKLVREGVIAWSSIQLALGSSNRT